MKATVSLITYQHAPFIVEAIESVLAQQTDFDWELIIGEDGSTDGTREIVVEYAQRHPERIRLSLNDRKNVIRIRGRVTGRWNYLNNLKLARGEYIALLDGDDFWTDSQKLQKQVEYMDAHPECTVCFTDATILQNDERRRFSDKFWKIRRSVYTLEELLASEFVPPSCSVMLRRSALDFPDLLVKTIVGDFALFVVCGSLGNFGCIPELTSVYRVHAGGVYTQGQLPGKEGVAPRDALNRLEGAIEAYQEFRAYLAGSHDGPIRARLAEFHGDAAWFSRRCGDYRGMRTHALWALRYRGWPIGRSAWDLYKLALLGSWPALTAFARYAKQADRGKQG